MKLKVFTKDDCPNCPPAKELAEMVKEGGRVEVEMYNTDEAEGLAESQFYSVLATPTIVLCDDDDNEIIAWRGEAPKLEEVNKKIES